MPSIHLDDVIVLGKSFQDNLQNLQQVFQRLRDVGLKLKPAKCNLCQEKVKYLGHTISASGVATDPSKVEVIVSWRAPTNRKEVQQFLGLCSYYRRFIRDFATIAKPLHRLMEKSTDFRWTPDGGEAFRTLKQKLASAPILSFLDPQAHPIPDTDASNDEIGAIHAQQVDGVERVIAYGSRVLTKAERRYCATRWELLAVVTFLKQFRPYLLGRPFTVRTDYGSMTWLRNFKQPEGQLAR
jgi:hypothetical protein